MAIPLTEAEFLARRHRRRRWMFRLGISLLLILLMLTVVGAVLLCVPSGMTADEAALAYAQLMPVDTRKRAEQFLGKPSFEKTEDDVKLLYWSFITQGINSVDIFQCQATCYKHGQVQFTSAGKFRVEGWSAWMYRWMQLKERLRIW